ncbi:PAS domain S-box protein [Desulfohalobium retbaense]|uniref:histidine kinase n=1 Tax=Desulfohalobium retbaense (strain ATCC 49708 / DSM 5692 / JCM 16813 / HR100) TaxID=485915 RepID=C8X172_DESRD|nr:PAS domain S-box protein [Desulfohalobium retbaense]ACV68169.1 PAS/PAC sensor signal transduction histidine kinase [Desulfohalobium retbaense DSM 5692]
MRHFWHFLRHSLFAKIILSAGATLLAGCLLLILLHTRYHKHVVFDFVHTGGERLSTTIKQGTHYAMMLNSREDIAQTIANISKQEAITAIRIFNKQGAIKYSSHPGEVDTHVARTAPVCSSCHHNGGLKPDSDISQRTRILPATENTPRRMGIVTPIENQPSCSQASCHVHPATDNVLGILEVVMSLKNTDQELASFNQRTLLFGTLVFALTGVAIFWTIYRFVKRPVRDLIRYTRRISSGAPPTAILSLDQSDEIGELASAVSTMHEKINEKHKELLHQKEEYQTLFDHVPCIVTVQDRNFQLISYNREFSDKFNPSAGDFCFRAYKGRHEKCPDCPVERTFADGCSHSSEESVVRDGQEVHWLVTTSPICDAEGRIVAAMEMCLDITPRKRLERQLAMSEKKYHAIFNNIPNPVFVLDPEKLFILDCNDSVQAVYGYTREEILNRPFADLFFDDDRDHYLPRLHECLVINQARQQTKDKRRIFVTIRVSPSQYPGQQVLLVTTSDITKRLEAEQQLIQASKMATLGEMATGVAHELNQPLSVIKTASTFFVRKIDKNEPIAPETLASMAREIDGHVDRATKIINHMREFGHKSEHKLYPVQVNTVLQRAFEIFSQQLKLRQIEISWNLETALPHIQADPDRLEQVFINLLINARDAIETRHASAPEKAEKRITLASRFADDQVQVCITDSGIGIAPGDRDKIFEPFYTTKEVGKGTGLGLSISYGIIQECGGRITVFSHGPGHGATFSLHFPPHPTSA